MKLSPRDCAIMVQRLADIHGQTLMQNLCSFYVQNKIGNFKDMTLNCHHFKGHIET